MRNNGTVEGVNFNTSTTTTTTTTTVAHHQHHRCLTVELLTGEQIVIPYEVRIILSFSFLHSRRIIVINRSIDNSGDAARMTSITHPASVTK